MWLSPFNTNNYRIISRIYFRTYSHHRINKKCTFVWYVFGIVISIIISILFTFVYVYLLNNIKFHYFPKYAWLIFILPIITIVLLIDVDDYFKLFNSHINIFVNIIGLALSNLTLFIIFLFAINSTNIKLELQIEKQKGNSSNQKQTTFSTLRL